MTGSSDKVTVSVEWAWQGKEPEDRGYRLLACSTGDISAGNFSEILDRFVPGTLDKLPQATVSYVPGVNNPGYLSMAFHEEAAGGLDRLGRDVTFTRFFCMPYRQLAAGAVSYRAMYQAFERIRLPDAAAPPFPAELSCSAATIPGDAARALPVVELLLTGNPVCIVDAESTSMAERLAYIDTVMSLLPYGMRAEMAAATWTSSTYRGHRYRLFFSEAPRRTAASGLDDHVVRWRPDTMIIEPTTNTRVPPEFGAEYREWLQGVLEGPSVITELAQETAMRAFKDNDIVQILDQILDKRKRLWSRPQKRREIAARNDETLVSTGRPEPWPGRQALPGASPDSVDHLLEGIARALNNPAGGGQGILPYQHGLQDALKRVRPSIESRKQYRARIVGSSLLRDSLPMAGNKKVGFYKLLLQAAFGESVSYADYCEIEEMLHGKVPDKPLLQAIEELLTEDLQTDQRALFIVRYHLSKGKYQKTGFDLPRLLAIATNRPPREDHAGFIWDAIINSLKDARSAAIERDILPLLCRRGFLALELQQRAPTNLEFQMKALIDLLSAVYKGRMGRDALLDVLSGARERYPTLALFLAVWALAADEDAGAVFASFMCGLGESENVPRSIRFRLAQLGYSRDLDGVYEEVGGGPAEGGTTISEMLSSRTDAVRYINTMQSADQPKEKRSLIRRVLNPSGDFPISEEKSKISDDR